MIIFQSEGVWLARRGVDEHVQAAGFAPLPDLNNMYRENGGRFLACVPCLKTRNLGADDLLDGTELIAAGVVVKEFLEATNVAVY